MSTDRRELKYQYMIVYDNCPHCGCEDTEEEYHILDGNNALCGRYTDIEQDEIQTDAYRWLDNGRLCNGCKRKLDNYDKAVDGGFDGVADYTKQAKLDLAKYNHWMKHGSLAGFTEG